jgi:NADH:ubiquinone oxidoreductase subunit 6 (subunit J)
MNLSFALIALLILASAVLAATRRDLIHSALLLVGNWLGVAFFYLWAGAEFVAFAQALVYVGAVSMVVLFAVLLTRRTRTELPPLNATRERALAAVLAGAALFGVLAVAVLKTRLEIGPVRPAPSVSMLSLGQQLMGPHAAAVLIIGVLLTVSLLGAVVLASSDAGKGDAS